jgi:hypothetical protein
MGGSKKTMQRDDTKSGKLDIPLCQGQSLLPNQVVVGGNISLPK